MDIAVLILAPLLLALIYCWSGIGKLPTFVRVGLPVGLLAGLFVALIGYGPAVQEAVATNTPLIRDFGDRIFAIYLDGLSLLFALLITGVGAIIALYAGATFAEGDVHRRFVRTLMALVGSMIGFVLTDHAEILPVFWAFTAVFLSSLIDFGRPNEVNLSNKYKRLWEWVRLGRLPILLLAMRVLEEGGASAKGMTRALVEVSQLSAANLSNSIVYELFLGVFIFWLLLETIFTTFQWRPAKHMSASAHAVVSIAKLLSMIYPLARLYPAIHDNPLWWNVVTGIGLFIILIGAVWALRQRDLKAILVCRSMSLFGACVALLGLPEFLGVKVALIGIVVQALSGSALFLSLDTSDKRSRLIVVGLATLPLAIFHVLMIGAFYQVTLAWAGIALAVVVVSTALWGVSTIGILRGTSRDEIAGTEGRPSGSPLQVIVPGVLGLASLVCIVLFDAIFVPLLNPMMTKQSFAGDTITPLILAVVALIGGVVLYATRDTWGRFIQAAPLAVLDNVHEV